MSKKRTAERELNHDNWNDEETPDEQGQFRLATEESMRERKVIKAKRRGQTGSNPSENLFSAFKGFSNTPAVQPTPGTFDFLKNMNQPKPSSATESNSTTTLPSTATSKTSPGGFNTGPPPDLISNKKPFLPYAQLFKNDTPAWQSPAAKPTSTENDEPSGGKAKRIKADDTDKKSSENANSKKSYDSVEKEAQQIFEDKVKHLNIKFVNFIHDKVKANPNVILFPPLDDYRKYVEKFVKEKLEYETSKKFEKEGFNFEYIPPQGGLGNVTLQNNKSGEVKTFQIGGSGTNAKDSESKTPKFTGFSTMSTTTAAPKESFFSFTASSTDAKPKENGTKQSPQFSAPAVTPGFSFKSSEKSDTPLGKLSASEPSKPNFFGNMTKSDSKSEETKPSATPSFSWESSAKTPENKPDSGASKPSFSFGLASAATSQPSFSFVTKSTDSTLAAAAPKPFSFGFANAPPPAPSTQAEDDDDVLPKEEVKEVVEEDSIFNIKCKIFVMKPDKSYGERGVGNLFVKSIEEKVKAQVIVRTETDTGKIIFNVVVTKNVPIKREKNNLIMVTVPHPTTEKDPKPVTCLIRVKTQDDAEKLLKCLEEFKA